MPLVFSENEATESGISYDDQTGISYQYPVRYRKMILPGERFIYYRGRKKREGGRALQVYFGTGVVGAIGRDAVRPDRLVCEVLDYQPFATAIPFKAPNGEYMETGGGRRGYFQPGVRTISDADFRRILEVAQLAGTDAARAEIEMRVREHAAAAYASPTTLRLVEDFAIRVALTELGRRCPGAALECQPRNNPGFDILVRHADLRRKLYVEVKGTTRGHPQFIITEGEVQFSRRNRELYALIVVYAIRADAETYKLWWHEGPIDGEGGIRLTPLQWSCEFGRNNVA